MVCDYLTKVVHDRFTGTFITNFLQNNIKTNQLEINTDVKTFKTTAKLKEPRELFALPKELDCPQQAPRWPTECQVSTLMLGLIGQNVVLCRYF